MHMIILWVASTFVRIFGSTHDLSKYIYLKMYLVFHVKRESVVQFGQKLFRPILSNGPQVTNQSTTNSMIHYSSFIFGRSRVRNSAQRRLSWQRFFLWFCLILVQGKYWRSTLKSAATFHTIIYNHHTI
jgi:hypothetical protein